MLFFYFSLESSVGSELVKNFDSSIKINLDQLEAIDVLSGGTGGVVLLKDPNGQKFTMKCSLNEGAFKEELLADSLYRSLGAFAPDFAIYKDVPQKLFIKGYSCSKNGFVRISEFIEKTDIDPSLVMKKISKHFIIDSFLSNWDVATYDLRNVIVRGKAGGDFDVYRIDNGGSLRYRALGELKKPGKNWSPSWVSETTTLRSKDLNSAGYMIYNDLSNADLQNQAIDLVLKSEKLFADLDKIGDLLNIDNLDVLKTSLASRLQDLLDRYVVLLKPDEVYAADRYARAKPGLSSAGVFLWSKDPTGKPVVLLSKRVRQNVWDTFGGSSDLGEEFLFQTAIRETVEESLGLVQLTEQELMGVPSHDYIVGDTLFRTYYVKHSYFPASDINSLITGSSEKTEFKWFSIEELVKGLLSGDLKSAPNSTWTTAIDGDLLYAPFYMSSRQEPALDILNDIQTSEPLLTRTMMAGADPDQKPTLVTKKLSPRKERTVRHSTVVYDSKLKGVASKISSEDNIRLSKQIADAVVAKSRTVAALKKEPTKVLTAAEADSINKTKNLPFSQSESHLSFVMKDKFIKGNAKANVETFLRDFSSSCRTGCLESGDTYTESLSDALVNETKNREYDVFYHGTEGIVGFMYDLYTEFRKQLLILGGDDLVALRASNRGFDKFADADDFYAIFASSGSGMINYREGAKGAYTDFGLSVNPFLFGSDGVMGSETYRYFFDSGSGNAPMTGLLFEKLTKELGVKFSFEKYNKLYNKYFANPNMNFTKATILNDPAMRKKLYTKNGRLFQILIRPDSVDKVGYLAIVGGERLSSTSLFTQNDLDSLSKVIQGFRSDPMTMIAKMQNVYISRPVVGVNDLQARLFLNPKYFLDPAYVKIKSYYRFPLKEQYEKEFTRILQEYVSSDIALWLSRMITLESGVFDSNDSILSVPAIQRLYKEVYKSIGGLPMALGTLNHPREDKITGTTVAPAQVAPAQGGPSANQRADMFKKSPKQIIKEQEEKAAHHYLDEESNPRSSSGFSLSQPAPRNLRKAKENKL